MSRANVTTGTGKRGPVSDFSDRDNMVAGLSRQNLKQTATELSKLREKHPIRMISELGKGNGNLYILVKVIHAGAFSDDARRCLYLDLLSMLVTNDLFHSELTYSCLTGGRSDEKMTPANYAVRVGFQEAADLINRPRKNIFVELKAENAELKAENEELKAKNAELVARVKELERERSSTELSDTKSKSAGHLTSRFASFFAEIDKAPQTESNRAESNRAESNPGNVGERLAHLRGMG